MGLLVRSAGSSIHERYHRESWCSPTRPLFPPNDSLHVASGRVRAPGGGDRQAIEKQPGLLEAFDELVWPERWTLRSSSELARQLQTQWSRRSW